jgi:putative DNA topoisomerase
MSKIDHSLFSVHEQALEKEPEPCPKCGASTLVKHRKSGSFIGCESYPSCDYTRPLFEHQDSLIKILEGSECPECSSELAVKNGRFGMFIGCTNFPECHYIAQEPEPEEVLPKCPSCHTGTLTKRSNKTGKTFYSCDAYPKCKYILNFRPISQTCPQCNWPVMVEKNMASGKILQCPQKHCNHKQTQ